MKQRPAQRVVTAVLLPLSLAAGLALPTHASQPGRPATYVLSGDPGGSKFEGIGVTRNQRTFYVSEVTGGEIHRGDVRTGATEEWLPEGADGRFTARGITTDAAGRVYIAGGPNGLGTGRPDVWVYDANGSLLAALRMPSDNAFVNDVAIGPDGAAYFTNSNAPQIFRVSAHAGTWTANVWADGSGEVDQQPGFNLGGVVVTPDRKALVVAQGNVGALWRFDLATGSATRVAVAEADLVNADGLVLRGHRLFAVRNFSQRLTTLALSSDGRSARLRSDVATDPSRVFTTAKLAHGRLLLVDSKFDEPVAAPPYEVVLVRLSRLASKP
jgi:streptogramin lyase